MDLYSFDDDYVRRLRDGDRTTEEHFLHYFRELLLIKLRSRVKSMAVIDDIRQEVFLRVFRAIRSEGGIRDGRKLGAFVNAVCNNVMLEYFRAGSRTEALTDEHETVADMTTPADVALATVETQRHVQRVLEKLPRKDAAILRAIFLEEQDKDEICLKFGVDRDYLRVLVHRAKEKFRAGYGSVLAFPSPPGVEPPQPWPPPGGRRRR